jgi:hypothetical protein
VHGGQERRGEAASWPSSGGVREGEDVDRRGPRVSERKEREGKPVKGANQRRKSVLKNAPEALGLNGQGEKQLPEGRGGLAWVGGARSVGPNSHGRFNGKLIFEFQWNLKFGKNLENSTRRFWRNLSMEIFLKFF